MKMKIINGKELSLEGTIMEHGKLVHSVCHSLKMYASSVGFDYDDLHSVGIIGLIDAYEKYDSSLNNRFSSFAVPLIRFSIMVELNKQTPTYKYPRETRENANLIHKNDWGNKSIEFIMDKLDLPRTKVVEAMDCLVGRFPIAPAAKNGNDDNGEDNDGLNLHNTIGEHDENFTNVELEEFKNMLSEIDYEVFKLRKQAYTQVEIAKTLNVSQPTVSRSIKNIKKMYLYYLKRNKEFSKVEKIMKDYDIPQELLQNS